jgi:ADP-ribose pyrophosphatase YjhB (NUDIX family)
MKFCSSCGNSVNKAIPEGDNRERYVCSQCSEIHYQNPKVISGIIPVYGDQVLLCKRAIEPRLGFWTLPAGFLENGESSLEGALRECKEEANATVINPQFAGLFDIPQINQVYVFYRGELTGPAFGPSSESSEVALFSEQDIPWDELAFPVIELALNYFFEDRKTGRFTVKHDEIRRPWKSRRPV